MSETSRPTGAYSNMKESRYDAIRLAGELGLSAKVQELERVPAHGKSVFRNQPS